MADTASRHQVVIRVSSGAASVEGGELIGAITGHGSHTGGIAVVSSRPYVVVHRDDIIIVPLAQAHLSLIPVGQVINITAHADVL